jgi:hypothetical protein
MTDVRIPSLITPTAQAGYELAIKLSRTATTLTQPDAAVRTSLQETCAKQIDNLTMVSHVVAVNFSRRSLPPTTIGGRGRRNERHS